jgi:hypothetical protein
MNKLRNFGTRKQFKTYLTMHYITRQSKLNDTPIEAIGKTPIPTPLSETLKAFKNNAYKNAIAFFGAIKKKRKVDPKDLDTIHEYLLDKIRYPNPSNTKCVLDAVGDAYTHVINNE